MNEIHNPQTYHPGIAETSFEVGDRVKVIYLPGAVKNKNLTEQMEGFLLDKGKKQGKMTVAKVVLDNGQQYSLDAEWLEKLAPQQKDDSTAPQELRNSQNSPLSLEKQLISEFSRLLQPPRYSPHYQRWVSTGFEKEIGWQSQSVPSVIQEAVYSDLFRINDNYPRLKAR